MKLENLVPPLELCRKIPAGEFVGSALCWIVRPALYNETSKCKMWGYYVGFEFQIDKELKEKRHAPAPTLAEIMIEIDNLGGWCPTAYRLQNRWTVDYQEDNEDGLNDVVEQSDLDNPAAAALKLWLKLKGIE